MSQPEDPNLTTLKQALTDAWTNMPTIRENDGYSRSTSLTVNGVIYTVSLFANGVATPSDDN